MYNIYVITFIFYLQTLVFIAKILFSLP